ncbi:MAG: hypothetical protein K2X95_02350 [Flavobacteriaceae bacterium]|nr:hypothetical protein [Flavobacteriaceae bacterium]
MAIDIEKKRERKARPAVFAEGHAQIIQELTLSGLFLYSGINHQNGFILAL